MRIAVYHNQPPGGARRALHGFCSVLAQRHVLDIFTLTTADQSMLSDSVYGGTVTRLPFEPAPPIRRGFLLNDLRQSHDLDRLDGVNREAAELIDAGGYDVVLVDTCRFTFAPQVLRHLSTPTVYYCHHGPRWGDGVSEWDARSAYENARYLVHLPFRRRLEDRIRREDREMTRRARVVATNSAYSRARLRESCGVDAVVCPPGIIVPPHGPRRESRYVLSVGDLFPHKGHDLVLRAVATLPPRLRPDLHIVSNAVGRTYATRLHDLARNLGVKLLIQKAISDSELWDEYSGARLFAFGARREPLGLAPLEAMAHGLAVVAVGEGGLPETVIDGLTGFLVPPDHLAMGDRISQLIKDEPLRRRMGEAGRVTVDERWTCEVRTAALEAVLLQVASTPAAVACRLSPN